MNSKKVLVAGGGGFIGGHLIALLLKVDILWVVVIGTVASILMLP